MNFSINIRITNEEKTYIFFSSEPFDENMCYIDLTIPFDSNLNEILNKENILKELKKTLIQNADDEIFELDNKMISRLLNMDFNVLENIVSISLEPNELVDEFFEKNPILKSMNIYLNGQYSICKEDLDKINFYFGKYENVFLHIDGNDEAVSISDYKKTVNAIDEIVAKIKKYNLSPLEQIMYAYDLVRDRVYTKENEDESLTTSRDLTSVLLGDKIVCVGYANIFDKVLSNLGINTMMYSIKNKDKTQRGHRRNIVRVNDPKYNVDGVYYFDTTWDSKRSASDHDYLNSYRFFAKLKEDIEIYDNRFTDRTFEGYHEAMVWEFETIVEEDGLKSVPSTMINTINEISEFIDGKRLIDTMLLIDNPNFPIPDSIKNSFNMENVMEKLCEYRRMFFDEEISQEILLQVLFNVRKIEYYENPEKYPLNVEMFKTIVKNSGWIPRASIFDDDFIDFHRNNDSDAKTNRMDKLVDEFSQKTDLAENIERIKLTKTLRKICDKRLK